MMCFTGRLLLGCLVFSAACSNGAAVRTSDPDVVAESAYEAMTAEELAREYLGRIDLRGLVEAELAGEALRRGIPADRIPGLVEDISRAVEYPRIREELTALAAESFTKQDLLDLLERSGRVDLPPLSRKIALFADEMGAVLRLAVDRAVLNGFGLAI